MTEQKIPLVQYLFKRLHQLGVRSVHGVPSDYNLTALDHIAPCNLHWIGNANELNAGYSADAYARIKGISAIITGFGVGELSAINAIGGAFAEMAPVVNIVGTPPRAAHKAGTCFHHTLGNGMYGVFKGMYKGVTVAMAELHDGETASGEIDRVLRECILQSRPVYIELPTDMVGHAVDGKLLETPIDLSVPQNEKSAEDSVVQRILEKLYNAKQPLITVDGFASRFGYREEAQELVNVTGWPTTVAPFGKSSINETSANFHGVYAGVSKDPALRSWVQSCDLVLRLGPMDADTNTYGFSTIPDSKVAINLHRDSIEIDGSTIENVHVKHVLGNLLKQLDSARLPRYNGHESLPNPAKDRDLLKPKAAGDLISQDTFWQRISSYFQSGDIILTETGTASYGSAEFILPSDTTLIVSSIWLSIGYMLGACAGSSLALRDMIKDGSKSKGRTVLFEGDGSFQMTAQTISDIFRNRLDVVIFLLNNDGYTIERLIHGMEESYNNIHPWNYLEAPNYFGAPKDDPSYPVTTRRASNWGELIEIIGDQKFKNGKGFNMVEVMMTKEDGPDTLKNLCSYVAKRNRKTEEAIPLD